MGWGKGKGEMMGMQPSISGFFRGDEEDEESMHDPLLPEEAPVPAPNYNATDGDSLAKSESIDGWRGEEMELEDDGDNDESNDFYVAHRMVPPGFSQHFFTDSHGRLTVDPMRPQRRPFPRVHVPLDADRRLVPALVNIAEWRPPEHERNGALASGAEPWRPRFVRPRTENWAAPCPPRPVSRGVLYTVQYMCGTSASPDALLPLLI